MKMKKKIPMAKGMKHPKASDGINKKMAVSAMPKKKMTQFSKA